jgi:hypothetical protein
VYATIRSYEGNSTLADALAARGDEVKQIIGAIEGFRAYYLVRTDDGGAVSVTVCDDKAGAEATNRAAADWLGENMADVASSPPKISAGEVVLSS